MRQSWGRGVGGGRNSRQWTRSRAAPLCRNSRRRHGPIIASLTAFSLHERRLEFSRSVGIRYGGGVGKGEDTHGNMAEQIRPSPSISRPRQRPIDPPSRPPLPPSRSTKLGERRTLAAKRVGISFVGWDAVDHGIVIDRTAHEADDGRHGSSGVFHTERIRVCVAPSSTGISFLVLLG